VHVLDQLGIAGRAERDVVREDRRPDHVAVAVDRVDAEEDRDLEARLGRAGLEPIVHVGPVLERVLGRRVGVAAGKDRAEEQPVDVAQILGELALLGLRHLADLLVQGHLGEQGGDLRIEGGECGLARLRGLCGGRFDGHLLPDDHGPGDSERDQGQDCGEPVFHESGFYRLERPWQWSGLGDWLV
jgi:hypothetical protein